MFRLPLSGAVNQRITAPWFSPSLTVNYAGDPAIEDRVVTEVASYGKQLGWLNEIVLALAKKQSVPQETLNRLEKAVQEIETIKKEIQPSALDIANNALDQLKREQPDRYANCCAIANGIASGRPNYPRPSIKGLAQPLTESVQFSVWPVWRGKSSPAGCENISPPESDREVSIN